jgi:hypothetical protein
MLCVEKFQTALTIGNRFLGGGWISQPPSTAIQFTHESRYRKGLKGA